MTQKNLNNRNQSVVRIAKAGMLCAISVILVLILHFPIFPSASFLEYDPADVPLLLGTFLYGPWVGLLMTVVTSVIQAFTVSAQSGVSGLIMHVIATGCYVVVSGLIYRRLHTLKGAIIALVSGALSMTLIMIPLNLIVTPAFSGYPVQFVADLLLPAIIPFNLIKAFGNGILTFLLYKRIRNFFK